MQHEWHMTNEYVHLVYVLVCLHPGRFPTYERYEPWYPRVGRSFEISVYVNRVCHGVCAYTFALLNVCCVRPAPPGNCPPGSPSDVICWSGTGLEHHA